MNCGTFSTILYLHNWFPWRLRRAYR